MKKRVQQLIQDAKNEPNINRLLPSRSMKPDVVELRDYVLKVTNFLPTTSDIRERLWYIEHNTTTAPMCEQCGCKVVRWDYTNKRFRPYCSQQCTGLSGVVQERKRETNKQTHGSAYPAQSNEVRERYKATMTERYGAPYINQPPLINNGAYELLNSKQALTDMINLGMSTFDVAEEIGVSQSTTSRYMAMNQVKPRVRSQSSFQRDLIAFIQSVYVGCVVSNDRSVIKPQELDVVLPNLKLAFEADGIYWHSEIGGKKAPNYHINKTKVAAAAGYRLIHVFESDWVNSRACVESRILSLLGGTRRIAARKCEVKEISNDQYRSFLSHNHIQGYTHTKHKYGLYHDGQLVACIGFSQPRFTSDYEYELIRYCSLAGTTVVGGMGRLLSHFIKVASPSTIVSYCDLRWGDGHVYSTLGFSSAGSSKPNYWYIDGTTLSSRVRFQKHKLAKVLPIFDPSLSEWQNMSANGYDRIWDCGSSKWVLDLRHLQTQC